MIGRAGALLVDIGIDTVPRGYRIATAAAPSCAGPPACSTRTSTRSKRHGRRPACAAGSRTVKVQAPGPITLAAQLELPGGHRAITDPGAVRDLAGSLAEGVAAHRAQLERRLDTPVVVQFDEPSLPAALEGRLTGVTSLTPVHPVDESVAIGLLDDCVALVGAEVALHSCAAGSAVEGLAAQRHSCGFGRRLDADGRRSRRGGGLRGLRSHGAAGCGPDDRAGGAAVGGGGGQGRGRCDRPPRVRALGAARADRHHAGVWAGREPRRSGRAPPSSSRRRPPTRSPRTRTRSDSPAFTQPIGCASAPDRGYSDTQPGGCT